MKNTLLDLNNHLFEQIERLNDEDLTDEEIERELKRAEGMTKIAATIIQNSELAYKTMVHMDEYGYNVDNRPVPEMLNYKRETADSGHQHRIEKKEQYFNTNRRSG